MRQRLEVRVHGAVQGVGFRPFVYRLATELELDGWVLNDASGVVLEAEGERPTLETFLSRLTAERPPRARVSGQREAWLPAAGLRGFEVRYSDGTGQKTVLVLPDIATCADCLREVLDPADRRHRYPFTNCTSCGPRFTIIRDLPYDRASTTMAGFRMCPACRAEYEDPRDRRFHAQPNACPDCGPSLELWDSGGEVLARRDEALRLSAAALADGRIAAVKGLGGFHLMCDARNAAAVSRLRERKRRWEKPFALMVRDLDMARALCEVSEDDERWLSSPEAPITLLGKRAGQGVAAEVAPGNPDLGVMLPATPLHHLLLAELGFPVVATSGNRSEEPICTDGGEALARLAGMADVFLVHDRPIERHVDDSVLRPARSEPRVLRRARGLAPLPVFVKGELPPILAVGAHQKTTVALSVGRQVFLSQHIGDLATPEATGAFERVIADLLRLYGVAPRAVAHDLHPAYASTRWAEASGLPRIPVQHHHAHLASCLAENGHAGRALGVTWDGTGYGLDGTVWGGEMLLGEARAATRLARLRPFRLPGGDRAVREPRRVALALLHELGLPADSLRAELRHDESRVLARMLSTGFASPLTTSAGRLFDGVASLLGLRHVATFEGQAAMMLEWVADKGETSAYPLRVRELDGLLELDWGPLVEAVLDDRRRGVAVATSAARFHNGLAAGIAAVARAAGEPSVALTGGCFQNRLLTERACERLVAAGHTVLLHREVPANDGGISLGQVMVAAARMPEP